MSRSTSGTKKTTGSINKDSEKYVQRTTLGQSKRGTNGNHSAHIMGFGLANTILTHTPGRPLSDSNRKEFVRDMNHSANMRIKSAYGNVVLDERRDARIAHSYVNGTPIYGHSTATRAYQAYQSASSFTSMDVLAEELGNMRILNEETGGYYKVKNHSKYF